MVACRLVAANQTFISRSAGVTDTCLSGKIQVFRFKNRGFCHRLLNVHIDGACCLRIALCRGNDSKTGAFRGASRRAGQLTVAAQRKSKFLQDLCVLFVHRIGDHLFTRVGCCNRTVEGFSSYCALKRHGIVIAHLAAHDVQREGSALILAACGMSDDIKGLNS